MKVLPEFLEERGIFPVGYFARYVSADMMKALPLIEANGLKSQEGVIYNSF